MVGLATKLKHSKWQRPVAATLSLLALMALTACGIYKIDIDEFDPDTLKAPIPLVDRLPITVGIHYDEQLRNHHKLEEASRLEWYLGPPSIVVLDPLFSAMFKKVVPVESPSTATVDGQKISGVLSVTMENIAAPPSFRYGLTLYAPPGVKKTTVTPAINKSPIRVDPISSPFDTYYYPNIFARHMRNAAAALLVSFYSDPNVAAWMASHGFSEHGVEIKKVGRTRPSRADDLAPGETVSVVRLRSTVDREIATCVGRSIGESEAGIKVVSPAKFREGMYPWFEPGTTPTTVDGLAKLMGRPAVKRRIDELGVRYVVAVGGEHAEGTKRWGGAVSGGQTGVVLGGYDFKKSTRLAAVILDLKQARPLGEVNASASGAGAAGLLFIIPYFFPAPDTEAITCPVIAKRVVGFLKGDPRPQDPKPDEEKPQ